jgi:hypothetical protein
MIIGVISAVRAFDYKRFDFLAGRVQPLTMVFAFNQRSFAAPMRSCGTALGGEDIVELLNGATMSPSWVR